MTDGSDARIAPTAHYTAYIWHRLGLPYAELFATPEGRRLFWTFRLAGEWIAAASPALPSMVQYLELRHRVIDHALRTIEPDRVVELGAGLSRRGLYFALEHGVTYTEVDLPHMIDAKRRALEHAPSEIRQRAAEKLRLEVRDVMSPDFASWLTRELSGAKRPVVVAEGLFGYFASPDRMRLASAIAAALKASGGGELLCDIRSRHGRAWVARATTALRAAIWIVTRGRGAREDFANLEAVREFLLDAGFASAEPVAVEPACPELAHLPSPLRVWCATSAG